MILIVVDFVILVESVMNAIFFFSFFFCMIALCLDVVLTLRNEKLLIIIKYKVNVVHESL